MAVKMMLRDPIPVKELMVKLSKAGVVLTKQQIDFLIQHEGHQNISIEGNRVFCRTCNVRDQ